MPVAIAPDGHPGPGPPGRRIGDGPGGGAAAGVPITLSTTSSHSIETVAAAAPDGTRWFQLYVQADLGVTRVARRAGGRGRLRGDRPDRRPAGARLSRAGPALRLRPLVARQLRRDAGDARQPRADDWATLSDRLDSDADLGGPRTHPDLVVAAARAEGDPDRARTRRLAVEHGADAIVVCNHGARQLDRVAATADVLGEVVAAVDGRTEVWVDGGIRRGLDIVIALALGARGVLVGRPPTGRWPPAAQPASSGRCAILREELELALALLGTPTPDDITPAHLGASGPAGR